MAKVIDFDDEGDTDDYLMPQPKIILTGAEGYLLFMKVDSPVLWERGEDSTVQNAIGSLYADGWRMVGGPTLTPVNSDRVSVGMYVAINFERPTYGTAPQPSAWPFPPLG